MPEYENTTLGRGDIAELQRKFPILANFISANFQSVAGQVLLLNSIQQAIESAANEVIQHFEGES